MLLCHAIEGSNARVLGCCGRVASPLKMEVWQLRGSIQMAWGAVYVIYFAVMLYIRGDLRCTRTTTHTATDSVSFLDRPLPYQMRVIGLFSGFVLLSLGISVYAAARADDRLFLIQTQNLCLYTAASLWIFSIAKTYSRQMARQSPPPWIGTALLAICLTASPTQFVLLGLSYAMAGANRVRLVLVVIFIASLTAVSLAIMLLLVTVTLRSHLVKFMATASTTVDTTYLQSAVRRLTIPTVIIDLLVVVGASLSLLSFAPEVGDPGTIEQLRADELSQGLAPLTILYYIIPLAGVFQGWTRTAPSAYAPKPIPPAPEKSGRQPIASVRGGGSALPASPPPRPTGPTLAPPSTSPHAALPPVVAPSEPAAAVTISIPLATRELPPPPKVQSLMS